MTRVTVAAPSALDAQYPFDLASLVPLAPATMWLRRIKRAPRPAFCLTSRRDTLGPPGD